MEDIDLKKLGNIILKHFVLFIVTFCAIVIGGSTYVLMKTPSFETSALIHIQSDTTATPGIQELMGTSSQEIQNEIEIFKSIRVAAKLIERNNLRIKFSRKYSQFLFYLLNSLFKNTSSLGGPLLQDGSNVLLNKKGTLISTETGYILSFEDSKQEWKCSWDVSCPVNNKEITLLKTGSIPVGTVFSFSTKTTKKTLEKLTESFCFSPAGNKKKPALLRIKHSDINPYLSAKLVNQLISIYSEKKIKWEQAEAKTTEEFLEEIISALRIKLTKERIELGDFQKNQGTILPETQIQSIMAQVETLRTQIRETEVKLDILQGLSSKADSAKDEPLPSPIYIQDTALTNSITKYNALVLEKTSMLSSVKPAHPKMIEISKKILETSGTLHQLTGNIISSLRNELRSLEREYSKIMTEFSGIPQNVIKLSSLTTDIKITEHIYIFLLQKLYESQIKKGGTLSGMTVIDHARADLAEKNSPKGSLYLLIILILAFFTGILLIMIREFLTTVATSSTEIENLFPDIPIFAKIPQMNEEERLNNELQWKEIFRSLHTNISFSTTRKKQVIAITSSVPSEGKSFLLNQLAITCAEFDEKVIIIDADMRKPTQHIHNKVAKSPGLTNYLTTNMNSLDKVILKSAFNYDIIPAGEESPNPPQLLKSDKFREMLEQLKKTYQFILVDLPPVFAVTDPVFMSDKLDVLIFVVKVGRAPLNALNNIEKVMFSKIPENRHNIGIAINGIKSSFFNTSYGNDQNQYCNYNYGYGQKKKKKK